MCRLSRRTPPRGLWPQRDFFYVYFTFSARVFTVAYSISRLTGTSSRRTSGVSARRNAITTFLCDLRFPGKDQG
eukprot:scaffold27877_cov63-Phaeocystis_antarctica.AAC.3